MLNISCYSNWLQNIAVGVHLLCHMMSIIIQYRHDIHDNRQLVFQLMGSTWSLERAVAHQICQCTILLFEQYNYVVYINKQKQIMNHTSHLIYHKVSLIPAQNKSIITVVIFVSMVTSHKVLLIFFFLLLSAHWLKWQYSLSSIRIRHTENV